MTSQFVTLLFWLSSAIALLLPLAKPLDEQETIDY